MQSFSRTLAGLAATASLLALPLRAWADDAIRSDRPDFVESGSVVGAGRLQIETSFAVVRDRSGGTKTTARTTPTLLRIGVNDRVELRLETDGASRATSEDRASGTKRTDHGFADLSLGVKWHTQDGDEARRTPSVAWLAHVEVDSGSAAFRGDRACGRRCASRPSGSCRTMSRSA